MLSNHLPFGEIGYVILMTQLNSVLKPLKILKDPRWFQIIFLSGFLTFGLMELGWKAEWMRYCAIVVSAIITQTVWMVLEQQSFDGLKSAMITALGLCLLLKSDFLWVNVLASVLAISLKFLVRYKGKHVFNPANAGIILTILITRHAWISPGQWGSSLVLLFFFGAAGLMVLFRVSRLETGLAFFITYFMLAYGYHVAYLGWTMDVVIHKITNGSLLLFSFFMITDPRTIPNDKVTRLIWAVVIAGLSFWLETYFKVRGAPLWVLFFTAPITLILDKVRGGHAFQWLPQPPASITHKNIL